jgi:hypothetical protein
MTCLSSRRRLPSAGASTVASPHATASYLLAPLHAIASCSAMACCASCQAGCRVASPSCLGEECVILCITALLSVLLSASLLVLSSALLSASLSVSSSASMSAASSSALTSAASLSVLISSASLSALQRCRLPCFLRLCVIVVCVAGMGGRVCFVLHVCGGEDGVISPQHGR